MSQLARATSIFLDLYGLRPRRPDLRFLGDVSFQFGNLPWENLTKFIKKHQTRRMPCGDHPETERVLRGSAQLRLSEEVLTDHARLGTGGTCFSLTNALRRITTDLGYHAYPVMADMRHGPNIHCALLVELDGGLCLLDPGYLVSEPMSLRPDTVTRVRLPGSRLEYRSVRGRGEFELYTVSDQGEETFRYRLRTQQVPETDFRRFWLQSLDAAGMNSLHLNKVTSQGRLSAHNLNLRIEFDHGKTNVKLRGRYVEEVAGSFGIDTKVVRRAFEEWEKRRCQR